MTESGTLHFHNDGGLIYITFPSLEVPGIKHAYTTRFGGVSEGIFSTMNMSFSRGDRYENVLENYKRICGAIGTDYRKCVLSRQTHTANIRIVAEEDAGKGIIYERDYDDVDGMVTDVPGITLVTQFADCVGLLFYDPVKHVAAASHAGWKGTVGLIGKRTVEVMKEKFGCSPENIRAGVAPSIGPCCFEVDEPVYREFAGMDGVNASDIIRDDKNGKYHIDLWKANYYTLINSGLDKNNISVTDLCTKCHPDVFFSHRYTGGKRGNMAALICLD